MQAFWTFLLLAGSAVLAQAANFSGKWVIEMPGRGRAQLILVLNQVGKEVTGTISARVDPYSGSPVNTEVLGGVAEGDTISFYVWTGIDQPVKTFYKGTASGPDEIVFTVTGGPARGSTEPQKLVAKRTK
jgi:hypothetical protein